TNFRKNPYSSSPPRPQNAFVLFRRDFSAKLKLKEMKMNNGDVSRLASEEWSKQPKEVLRFFEFLENLAKDRHKKIYPDYSYSPKRKSKSKNDTCRKNNEVTSETFLFKSINEADRNFSESLSFNAQGTCNDIKLNTDYSDFTTNNSLSERERTLDFSEYIYFDPQNHNLEKKYLEYNNPKCNNSEYNNSECNNPEYNNPECNNLELVISN
ncbi:2058_t:CDS:2, partial [Racocetra fulgida]